MEIAAATNVLIMSAGLQTPHMPLTDIIPKGMLTIGGKPSIVQAVEQCVGTAQTENFYIKAHRLAGHLLLALEPVSQFGRNVRMYFEIESEDFDTAEGVKRIFEDKRFPRGESIPVLAGDVFCPQVNFGRMMQSHQKELDKNPGLLATLGIFFAPAREAVGRYGVVAVDKDGHIIQFKEKPRTQAEILRIAALNQSQPILDIMKEKSEQAGEPVVPVNSSLYILSPGFFETVREPKHELGRWDFCRDVFPTLLGKSLQAYIINYPLIDVGFSEDFWRAQFLFKEIASSSCGRFIKNWGAFGQRNNIDPDTQTNLIENGCVVGNDVYLRNVRAVNSFIGRGVRARDVYLENAVLLPFTFVNIDQGGITEIRNSIVGGALFGGTFVSPQTIEGRTCINKLIITPDASGKLRRSTLMLDDEKDIQRVTDLFSGQR